MLFFQKIFQICSDSFLSTWYQITPHKFIMRVMKVMQAKISFLIFFLFISAYSQPFEWSANITVPGNVHSIGFSSSGKTMGICYLGNYPVQIFKYNEANLKHELAYTLSQNPSQCQTVSITPDGQWLLVVDMSENTLIYKLNAGTGVFSLHQPDLNPVFEAIYSLGGAISDDHQYLVMGKYYGKVVIFEWNEGSQNYALEQTIMMGATIMEFEFATDSSFLVCNPKDLTYFLIYKNDGSSFVYSQNISLPGYGKLSLSDDDQYIMVTQTLARTFVMFKYNSGTELFESYSFTPTPTPGYNPTAILIGGHIYVGSDVLVEIHKLNTNNNSLTDIADYPSEIIQKLEISVSMNHRFLVFQCTGSIFQVYENSTFLCEAGELRDSSDICITPSACSVSNCQACDNSSICDLCDTDYWLFSNICYDSTCGLGCIDCDASLVECAQCSTGYALNPNTSLCYDTSCGVECVDCNVSSTLCSECLYGYWLYDNDSSCYSSVCGVGCLNCNASSHCIDCGVGYWLNALDHLCYSSECGVGCTDCETATDECQECSSSYWLNSYDNTCYLNSPCGVGCANCNDPACTTCASGYWLNYNDDSCYHSLCGDGCIDCNTSSLACSQCSDPGYWFNSDDSLCYDISCGFGCTDCNSTHCSTCMPGYWLYLNHSICYSDSCGLGCISCDNSTGSCSDCGEGYWLNTVDNLCYSSECGVGCTDCDAGDDSCDECSNLYWLNTDDERCYDVSCGVRCVDCHTDDNVCSACANGFWINVDDNECHSSECGDGCISCNSTSTLCLSECGSQFWFYSNDSLCYTNQCGTGCTNCNLTGSHCLQCGYGYWLSTETNACYPNSCGDGCVNCHLASGTCRECSSGYWMNKDDSQCYQDECGSGCTSCNNETLNCSSCASSFKLADYACVSGVVTFECTITGCETCANDTHCEKCAGDDYENNEGQCCRATDSCHTNFTLNLLFICLICVGVSCCLVCFLCCLRRRKDEKEKNKVTPLDGNNHLTQENLQVQLGPSFLVDKDTKDKNLMSNIGTQTKKKRRTRDHKKDLLKKKAEEDEREIDNWNRDIKDYLKKEKKAEKVKRLQIDLQDELGDQNAHNETMEAMNDEAFQKHMEEKENEKEKKGRKGRKGKKDKKDKKEKRKDEKDEQISSDE